MPSDDPKDSPLRPSAPAPGRRRWEKPRIESGQLFESNSLACSKSGPQIEECLQGGEPKS